MTFGLSAHLKSPLQRRLYRLFGPAVESMLGLKGTEGIYNESARLYREHPQGPGVFAWFDSVAQAVGTQEAVDLPAEFEFPKQGPLVIIANHPFGVIDPVMLARWAARFRPDLKVMTNAVLPNLMPELRDIVIPVDPFGGEGAAKRNLGPMKEALRLLRGGGALLIFPAGEVAAYKPGRGVEEPRWTNHLGSLVRRTQATVLPVYFPGSNSALFHTAGLIHPRLRTALLLREFCKREGTTVPMRVGNAMPYSRLKKFEDDESLTRYLRIHTFVLHQRGKEEAKLTVEGQNITTTPPTECQHERMVEEIDRLRARGGRLVGQGNLSVYQAHSHEIPVLLPEIGRLREVTFRSVGEGTGNDIDLDKYDRYYEHLILWDEEKEQVAGAYRLGRADMILQEYGPKGLYTNTLFHFEKPFLANLGAAVEMGRSFVVKEYQRTLASLPLLWKGIACWVARNPHYKKLFGPVSISKDYSSLSRKMIVEFLQDNRMHPHLSAFVKARNPFRYMRTRRMMREFISADLQNVDDCSALISSLETDGKGIPVLLKHYLKLNATILSFNVDKDFSSVVDGLILVDFTEIDSRLLSKYMGEESCREYLARHAPASLPPAPAV